MSLQNKKVTKNNFIPTDADNNYPIKNGKFNELIDAIEEQMAESANGIFSSDNIGGTVPASFTASITDTFELKEGVKNTALKITERNISAVGGVTNDRTYLNSESIATTAFAGAVISVNNSGLTNNDAVYLLLQNKTTGVGSDTEFNLRRANIGGSGSNYIDWLTQDGASQDIIFNRIKNGATTYGDVSIANGNFGVGTTTPTNKLEVSGNTDSTTYSVNGTAGANFSGAVTNITVVDGIVTAVS